MTADMLQGNYKGSWGAIWSFPACDPIAAERAGKQMQRCNVDTVCYVRRAVLRTADGAMTEVMILTFLPERRQRIFILQTGLPLVLPYLEDSILNKIATALDQP